MSFSIETSRLILRPFTMTDANDFFNITRDDDILVYVPGCYFDSLKETEEIFENVYTKGDLKRDFYIAIEEKTHHSLVGSLIITQESKLKYYDSSYFIKKTERKKGYVVEALNAFFKNFPIPDSTFIFHIEKDNEPSLGAIQKIDGIVELPNDICAHTTFQYHVD